MNKKSTLKKATKSDFDWFTNDSYKSSKHFDALTWADFIRDRLVKYWDVRYGGASIVDDNDEIVPAQRYCEEIQNGIIKLERTYSDLGASDGEKIYGDESYSPFWDDTHVIKNVSPLTVEDILRMYSVEDDVDVENNFSFKDLPPELQKWSATTDLKVSNPEGFYDIPYDLYVRRGIKLFDRPSTNQGLINLRIDLSVSNEEILSEMAKLLKSYRVAVSKTECKKGFITVKKSDVEKLFDYKVLPHFDLKLWAAYRGLSVTDTLIMEVLFGHSIDSKEFEGKQKKLYKKVFDFNYVNSLESYSKSLAT